MRIKRRYYYWVQGLLISITMSLVISFIHTVIDFPFNSGFPLRWLQSFSLGLLVAFPTSRLVVPSIIKLMERITDD